MRFTFTESTVTDVSKTIRAVTSKTAFCIHTDTVLTEPWDEVTFIQIYNGNKTKF